MGDYGCGVTADPDDPKSIAQAITYLYQMTEAERSAMGQRGHDAVLKNYTYEQLASRIVQTLGEERDA
ncbi:hypothetical protein D3C77_793950 [compost metagenome]